MTRTLRHVLAASACLLAVNSAHAQLSALGGLASSLGGMLAGATGVGTADAGYDVDGFVRKSADLSEVASRAVTAINAAFATDEQLTAKRAALAAIAAVAEPKERQTRYAALYAAESAETKRLLDSGEMEKRMAQLDSDKKKLIGQALLNFAIGSLQAIELGKHGQALVQQAGISPVELVRILPVKDAIPLLGKVAVDASGFVGGVMKLARAANISVPDARTGAAPVNLNV
ncbi:hypothetical protein IA69_03835 [Massilia sp. JS1662]|nr:hypothetical protein [Massilia sp. JS1662]KGF82879.1 hypothetical protein IA69_03835 [Massilia sp. JS1662]